MFYLGLSEKDTTAMALGLAHSLSRYKLKFSPDKVDTMIVQAICELYISCLFLRFTHLTILLAALLDDLDKELNNYIMRCREWFGWHFPEIGKIVTDHTAYAKVIKTMGFRTNALSTDFSEILPEEIEKEVRFSLRSKNLFVGICDIKVKLIRYFSQLFKICSLDHFLMSYDTS